MMIIQRIRRVLFTTKRIAVLMILLVLLCTTHVIHGFQLQRQPTITTIRIGKNTQQCHVKQLTTTRKSLMKKSALYVFERMSEECISAIVTAQKETNQYQLEYVDKHALFAGCVDHPESYALDRTLKQYRISYRLVAKTLKEIYGSNTMEESNNAGWLSGFRAATKQGTNDDVDTDRPFSREMKVTLQNAGKIANNMGSVEVRTHHIFLALLDYKEKGTSDGTPTATDSVYDVNKESTWYLIKQMNCVDDDVTPLKICQSLVTNLRENDRPLGERELVASGGTTGASGNAKMPTLKEYGTDLTQLAMDGLLDPVYGRDNEIRSCIRTLIRRRKNNVCLIGEPGVGKTAIAEGVAQILIDELKCPPPLRGHKLVSLELSSLVAGTKYRGEFEERLQNIIAEVTNPKAEPTILFIDEIHNLVGAGSASDGGTMDAANILKPALARGEMQIIGATTITEYRKYIEKDAALERRLQPVSIKEPSVEQTIQILDAVKSNYEKHHNVKYTPGALEAAAVLSERYITDRFLPDKALDLLDESGAITQLDYLETMESKRILDYGDEEEKAVPIVTEHTVAEVLSEMTGIPIGKLETNEMDRLRYLENEMTKRVKGQYRAIRGVARAIRRARSGLRDPKRPVASFLFCGPTGTGKTELCKTLAETYYGNEKDLIRIDMSEYMEKHTTSRLTGPPPGYIGYDAGGQLTEAVRRSPHSVVLLDEIEKAHEDVLNILLQIMEDGILTDGKGRTVNFKNTVIVMTSNVGSRKILELARRNSNQNEENDEVLATIQAIQARSSTSKSGASTTSATNNKNPPVQVTDQRVETKVPSPPVIPTPVIVTSATVQSTTLTTTSAATTQLEPLAPDEILRKLQRNPAAAQILMRAATDPEIMNAVRVAMNGSPADLLKTAQKNPTIATFLQDVWSAINDEENIDEPSSSNNIVSATKTATTVTATTKTTSAPKSGLDSIRTSFQETVQQWTDTSTNMFATGIMNQLESTVTTAQTTIEASASMSSITPTPKVFEMQSISNDERNTGSNSGLSSNSLNENGGEVNGDNVEHAQYPELIAVVKEELEATMKPEFLNRIDEIVVFSPLSLNNLGMIAQLTIEKIINRAISEHNLDELIVEPNLINRVRYEGSMNANEFGARPMRRAAQRYIEDSLSDAIISGFFSLENGMKETRASLSLLPSSSTSTTNDQVLITRMSDMQTIRVKIEDASGGIGGVPNKGSSSFSVSSSVPPPPVVNGEKEGSNVNGSLQTEPV